MGEYIVEAQNLCKFFKAGDGSGAARVQRGLRWRV